MAKKAGILRRLASGILSPQKREEIIEAAPINEIEKATSTMPFASAKFQIGQVVKHRLFPFRGVIFDVDPEFSNTDEWYEAIPEEVRPIKAQPYYHLFAENEKTHYVAYVSEQNLLPDETRTPVSHPDIPELFVLTDKGDYQLKSGVAN
jgi:heat shock protein HspQ